MAEEDANLTGFLHQFDLEDKQETELERMKHVSEHSNPDPSPSPNPNLSY